MITEFEYNNIKKEIDYYSFYYCLKDKNYNSDFIFTNALNNYIEYKKVVKHLTNTKLICATIKTICKRAVLKYMNRDKNYKTVKIENADIKDNVEIDKVIFQNELKRVLNILYDSLTEKEQVLYELLQDNEISKRDACKLVNISVSEYDMFVNKIKRVIRKYF